MTPNEQKIIKLIKNSPTPVRFVDIERVKALSDISNLFYISGAGIVGAYMGCSVFMNKK